MLNNCSSFLTKVTVYTIMAEIWKPSNKDLLLFLPSIASLHHPLAWTTPSYFTSNPTMCCNFYSNIIFHFKSQCLIEVYKSCLCSLVVQFSKHQKKKKTSKCCHLLRKNGIQWDGRGQNKDNAKEKSNWPRRLVSVCV